MLRPSTHHPHDELYAGSVILKHCKYKSLKEKEAVDLLVERHVVELEDFMWGPSWANAWGVCFLHFLLWPYTLLRSPCPFFTTVPPYILKGLIVLYCNLYEFYSVFTFLSGMCIIIFASKRLWNEECFFFLLETFQTLWFSELFSWELLYTWVNSMWISLYSPLCFSVVSSSLLRIISLLSL